MSAIAPSSRNGNAPKAFSREGHAHKDRAAADRAARDEQPLRSGADVLWQSLIREGVDRVFGYPGGAILPTYDALTRYPEIHHVLARHEQGATHMADGYARASGKIGVVFATSGPGATNLVTGLATAMVDSSPILCITGQVPTGAMGSDAFQEADTSGFTRAVCKHNYLVTDVDELAFVLAEACHVARSGRPGPVLIDLPKDVQLATTREALPELPIRLPGLCHDQDADAIERAAVLIGEAHRPVILAGHGILMAGMHQELRQLAERADLPVALTLLGKGGFSEDHPLCLGMMGMHGAAVANKAIQSADLLIALGMRFDDRVTGKLATYAPNARTIHFEIDPAEINKNVCAEVAVLGDLAETLPALLDQLADQLAERPARGAWRERIAGWRADDDQRDVVQHSRDDGRFLGAEAIAALHRATGGDVVNVTDVGQHQMLEAQYYPHHRPGTLFTSGGMGTMGFALPAAIGAKMARPDEEVWAIAGDGGFQMTMAELATAVQEGVEVQIAIINNGYLGMVRQWQEFFYEQRYAATPISSPDFCRVAEAFGVPSIRVSRAEDVAGAVEAARAHRGGPAIVELVVEQHDVVYPMVPAGAALDEMIRRPAPSAEPVHTQEAPRLRAGA